MVAVWNWVLTFGLVVVHAAFGYQLLRRFRAQGETWLESVLYSSGISFGLTSLAVLSFGIVGWLKPWAMIILLAALGMLAGRSGWRQIRLVVPEIKRGLIHTLKSRSSLSLLLFIAAVLVLGALVASAPLTGSDAMVYHFDVPRLYGEASRIFPLYSKVNSFFSIGSGHMLIVLGMLIGNDRTALGLCYLGGLLALIATYAIARKYLSRSFSLLASALFVVTPMTFWQMTVAGAPDMWTTFYTMMSVVCFINWIGRRDLGNLTLCGFFAGIAAGSKYTGWATPLILALLLAYYSRLSVRTLAWFAVPLLVTATWRHVINFVWTGDPFFPFLSQILDVYEFNAFTYQKIITDTKAPGFQLSPVRLLTYPFLLTLDGKQVGIGHYFGPLILAFSPLILPSALSSKLKPILIFSIGFFATNWVGNQIGRFLLPIFPLVLVLSINSLSWLRSEAGLRLATHSCNAMLGFFLLFGVVSDTIYAKDFLLVTLGRENERAFLRRMAPDYQASEYINEYLSDKPGVVMVFFRHTYYLTIPFINGDPRSSWIMNPQKIASPESLYAFLQERGIRWVVNAADYPPWFSALFERLEMRGLLTPVASREVENFAGKRIYGRRERTHVVILKVEPGVEATADYPRVGR